MISEDTFLYVFTIFIFCAIALEERINRFIQMQDQNALIFEY